jgi:hypothetical protein
MRKSRVFHPVLFAISPALVLLSNNLTKIPVKQGLRPLLLSAVLGLASLSIFYLITRDWHYSAYLATLSSFFFLAYGHVYAAVHDTHFIILPLGKHSFLLPAWIGILVLLGGPWSWKRLPSPEHITKTLNFMSIILILIPGVRISLYLIETRNDAAVLDGKVLTIDLSTIQTDIKSTPDIYYIILDEYGRADSLHDIFGIDNQEFLSFLEEQGFYVAEESNANYTQTALSLSSSLNMSYLDRLQFLLGEDSSNREPLIDLIRNSAVADILQQAGYQIVTFASGYEYTEIEDADLYSTPFIYQLNSFESLWLSTTAAILIPHPASLGLPIPNSETQRVRILHSFEQLASVGRDSAPQFIFAHIIAPHPPFVFDAEGNVVDQDRRYHIGDGFMFLGTTEQYIDGFSDQLLYVNLLTENLITDILAQSEEPPIIIIQGDHGPGAYLNWESLEQSCPYERFPILNAYFIPDVIEPDLYPSLSPVNSFRVILNAIFDANMPLLEDQSYFSGWLNPYEFILVSDEGLQSCPALEERW